MEKFKKTRVLVISALMCALSIVMGKFLQIPVGDSLRFSFENTPLFLCGFCFGPVIGALTAIAADILGSILRGYSINLFITLGAVIIGFSGGLAYHILRNIKPFFRILLSVLVAYLLGAVLVKTIGLSHMYGTPYHALLLMRTVNYLIMLVIDTLVLYFIFKNRALKKLLESFK